MAFFALSIFFISRYDLGRGRHEEILQQLPEARVAD
jgi:hypothetical protein